MTKREDIPHSHLPTARASWPDTDSDSPVPLRSVHPDPYGAYELAPATRADIARLATQIATARAIEQREPRSGRAYPSEDLWPLLIVVTMLTLVTILALVTIAVVVIGT
jgi:hypothetical protein